MNLIEKSNKTNLVILLVITLIGAALRFYNYSSLTLFNDELSALTRCQYGNFIDLIQKGVMPDMHPAGIQFLLFLVTRIFGYSEAVVRFPFVLAGILAIPVIYFTGKKLFNETTGLLAAAAVAVLQYPVMFSQQARPYSIGMLVCLLFVYFLSSIIKSKEKADGQLKWQYAAFIGCGAASMYIHYFTFLFAGIAGLAGLFYIPKNRIKAYLLCGTAMVILALPHYPIYYYQLSVGGLGGPGGWLGPPDGDTFRKYLFYVFNNSNLIYFLFIGVAVISFIVYRKTLLLTRFHLFSLILFLAPFLIAWFYSVYVNPVLQFSILIFSFPYLLLLIFSFLPENLNPKILFTFIFIILASGSYSTIIEQKYYKTEHYGVFKELAQETIDLNNRFGDKNITNTFNVYEPFFINYYFEKLKRPVSVVQYRCMEPEKIAEFRDIVSKSTTPYFLHAWSNIYDAPEIDDIIRRYYPYRIVYNNHFNSALSFYSRNASDSVVKPKLVFSATHDFEVIRWNNDENFISNKKAHNGAYSSDLSGYEYGNTFKAQLKQIGFKKGDVVSISFWLNSTEIPTDALLVATIQDSDGKSKFWQSGSFDVYVTEPNKWQQFFFTFTPAGDFTDFDELKIFPWNQKKKNLWIDDLEINIKKP